MDNNDVIANSLGIPSMNIPPPPNPVVIPSKEKNDYEYARQNMYDIIEKGQNALEDIVDIYFNTFYYSICHHQFFYNV
jgi:hypothetical protein